MSENLNQDNITPTEEPTASKEEVKKDFKGLLESTKVFLHELLDIRHYWPAPHRIFGMYLSLFLAAWHL